MKKNLYITHRITLKLIFDILILKIYILKIREIKNY